MKPTTPAARSGIPARGLSRTDRARRGVTGARSYGPLLRFADNIHGIVDARRTDAPLAALPWCRRLQETYNENCLRILAGTRDVLTPQLIVLASGRRQLAMIETQLASLEQQVDAVRAGDPAPGNGERHLPPAALTARSERRAGAVRARLTAERERLRDERETLRQRLADAESIVLEEFDMATEIAARMRAFYQRRLHTYARRFLGRRDVADLTHDLLPAWAASPCPWLTPAPVEAAHVTPTFA